MRISTSKLLALLTDLTATASTDQDLPALNAVLLHTTRGHYGAEPGLVELLAGASTDRRVAGHAYTCCSGQWTGPSLWRLRDVQNVITVFKAARGKDKEDLHAVEIHRSGGEIEIREDPNLIDDGVHLSFGEMDPGDFPARSLYSRILDVPLLTSRELVDRETGTRSTEYAVTATDLAVHALAPFIKVAKRRGGQMRVYRSHQNLPLLVQIGQTYRGTLMPVRIDREYAGDLDEPDVAIYAPDLSDSRWDPTQQAATPAPAGGPMVVQLPLSDLADTMFRAPDVAPDDTADAEPAPAGV